ncbi:hypothetical protein ONZ45_g17504 [Pleurotus djamor]|nr:hypothetical protein ONZ45_g17504 [Pleurotus djamor]
MYGPILKLTGVDPAFCVGVYLWRQPNVFKASLFQAADRHGSIVVSSNYYERRPMSLDSIAPWWCPLSTSKFTVEFTKPMVPRLSSDGSEIYTLRCNRSNRTDHSPPNSSDVSPLIPSSVALSSDTRVVLPINAPKRRFAPPSDEMILLWQDLEKAVQNSFPQTAEDSPSPFPLPTIRIIPSEGSYQQSSETLTYTTPLRYPLDGAGISHLAVL